MSDIDSEAETDWLWISRIFAHRRERFWSLGAADLLASKDDETRTIAAGIWSQPQLNDPNHSTPYIIHANEIVAKRREEENADQWNSASRMHAWYALTFEEQSSYGREQRQEDYQRKLAQFNANMPLSPSVSGDPSDDSDYEEGGINDRRAMQQWNRYRRDYKPKGPRAIASNTKASFPFQRLPFDIRRSVYELLTKQHGPVVQMNPDGSGKHCSGPIDLRVAVTSKTLFAEVMRTFFEENIIQLEIYPAASLGLPTLFDEGCISATYWPSTSIKSINLFISYNQIEHGNFVSAEISKLGRVLEKCSSIKIRITAYCRTSWFEEGMDQGFDQALTTLESLRGVLELTFINDFSPYLARGLYPKKHRFLGTKGYQERLKSLVTRPKSTEG